MKTWGRAEHATRGAHRFGWWLPNSESALWNQSFRSAGGGHNRVGARKAPRKIANERTLKQFRMKSAETQHKSEEKTKRRKRGSWGVWGIPTLKAVNEHFARETNFVG